MYSFFADQTRLESVRLRGILGGLERIFSQLCSCMLDSCPKLRHLRVESRALSLSGAALRKIVESRLTTLCVRTPKLDVDSEFRCQLESRNLVNTRLRTLVLDGDVGEAAQLAFIGTFRRLRTLELRAVTDQVLQFIWKYQVRKRTRCPELANIRYVLRTTYRVYWYLNSYVVASGASHHGLASCNRLFRTESSLAPVASIISQYLCNYVLFTIRSTSSV